MFELFEKYYTNSLSKEERSDFEKKMKSNDSIAQDYGDFVMMMEHLDKKEEINTALNSLNEVHDEKKRNTPIFGIKMIRLLVAAILLPFLVYTVYFVTSTNYSEESAEEIFASNFKSASISLIGKGIDSTVVLAEINADYNNANYSEVINALSTMEIDSFKDNRIWLMMACSYIEERKYSIAREALLPLENAAQFQNDFYWYTAMSFLGEGNVEKARSFLRKIPEDSNYFARAKDILAK
jgi:hypothetical protein